MFETATEPDTHTLLKNYLLCMEELMTNEASDLTQAVKAVPEPYRTPLIVATTAFYNKINRDALNLATILEEYVIR